MQRIVVVQQDRRGEEKVRAVERRGQGVRITRVVNLEGPLPPIIDEPAEILGSEALEADLVLSFLAHPDLIEELALRCQRQEIPLIASGRKVTVGQAIAPPT